MAEPPRNSGAMRAPSPHANRLVGGTALNLAGQAGPLIIGLVTVPMILHGLGPERFGIFSLTLSILGTAGQFDLGLPRATTKFLAELLTARDERRARRTFWTSVLVQALIGVLMGALVLLMIPAVESGILKVGSGLAEEMKSSLVCIALSLPFLMLTSTAKGALDAGQHFAITSTLRVVLSSSMYAVPVIALYFHAGLPGIFVLLLMVRIVMAALHFGFCFRVYGGLGRCEIDLRLARPLVSFGGWVVAASLTVAGYTSIDRFLIGSMRTTTEVGFYSAPVDALNRLFILPASFVGVLYPAFSGLSQDKGTKLSRIAGQAIKFLTLLMAPVSLVLAIFAEPILRLWLGPAFAAESAGVFRVAALTVMVSSIGSIPNALLQAIGRPDLPARFVLLEAPLFLFLLWVLIRWFGPLGAAIASLIRVSVEVLWFVWALRSVRPDLVRGAVGFQAGRAVGAALVLMATMWPAAAALEGTATAQIGVLLAGICAFVWISWCRVLESSERAYVMSVLTRGWLTPARDRQPG